MNPESFPLYFLTFDFTTSHRVKAKVPLVSGAGRVGAGHSGTLGFEKTC